MPDYPFIERVSQRIAVPFQHQRSGDLMQFPYTPEGTVEDRKKWWVTPIQLYDTNGFTFDKFKTVPTLARYEGNIEFVVWDKRQRTKPKKVGVIKIDTLQNTFYCEVEIYYQRFIMNIEFNIHYSYTEPDPSQAYRNNTAYGDWAYREVV